ncbi:albusnodin family lasso peptide [Streptomyces sp. NPDC048290]
MNEPLNTTVNIEDDLLPVEIGEIAELTEGQGGTGSEDKRRMYN